MRSVKFISFCNIVVGILLLSSCKSFNEVTSSLFSSKKLRFCAAVRGNGTFMYTHFGSLARVVEEYGELDAIAGGSSASVSAFFYESIVENPIVKKVDEDTRRLYIATMFKSMLGFLDFLGQTEESLAISYLYKTIETIKEEKLFSLFKVDWFKATSRLAYLLNDEEVVAMVNPEIIKDLNILHKGAPESYIKRIEDIFASIAVVAAFEGKGEDLFFREGIINFEGFSENLGKTANFLAGHDKVSNEKLKVFLEFCAVNSKAKSWQQISEVKNAQGNTCEDLYIDAANTFKRRLDKGLIANKSKKDRIRQELGKTIPAFVPTAILDGETAVNHFKEAEQRYYKGEAPNFRVNFSDVKFGYYVPDGYQDTISRNLKKLFPNDAKSNKALILNPSSPVAWSEALTNSPLEPGLGKIKVVSNDRAFIGGFADLQPVQILRAAGCENIIYLNRIGQESAFLTKQRSLEGVAWGERQGVVELLNISPKEHADLYLKDNPNNSYQSSVENADAVWCTDWDHWNTGQNKELFNHSYALIPTEKGPNKGHITGISIHSKEFENFYKKGSVRTVTKKYPGCD